MVWKEAWAPSTFTDHTLRSKTLTSVLCVGKKKRGETKETLKEKQHLLNTYNVPSRQWWTLIHKSQHKPFWLILCPSVASTIQKTGEVWEPVNHSQIVWTWIAEPWKEDRRNVLCNNKVELKIKKDISKLIKINCLLYPWLNVPNLPCHKNHVVRLHNDLLNQPKLVLIFLLVYEFRKYWVFILFCF